MHLWLSVPYLPFFCNYTTTISLLALFQRCQYVSNTFGRLVCRQPYVMSSDSYESILITFFTSLSKSTFIYFFSVSLICRYIFTSANILFGVTFTLNYLSLSKGIFLVLFLVQALWKMSDPLVFNVNSISSSVVSALINN